MVTALAPGGAYSYQHLPVAPKDCKAMARTADYDTLDPSPEILERGKKFSQWLTTGLRESPYSNVSQLATAMGRSRQTLYPFFNNCIAGDGRFRSPGENITKSLASFLGLNWQDGVAIIKGLKTEAVTVSGSSSEKTQRVVGADSLKVLDYYERLPPGPLRQAALSHLESLNRIAGEDFHERTDIIGKPADSDEEGITRISVDDE